jgi:hypothetical protein
MTVVRDTDVRFYDVEHGGGGGGKTLDHLGGVGDGDDDKPGPKPGPKSTATRQFYKLIFEAESKQSHPLCRDIFDQTGAWTSGKCEAAAAYTVWTLVFSENLPSIFSADGTKTPITYSITSSITLPEWKHGVVAAPDDKAEITRATVRTAHHEAGHGKCPEEVVAAVQRFWDALPAKIPRADVPAVNNAVYKVVTKFYQHLGRNVADIMYDSVSRHGYIQGAVFNKNPDTKGDNRTKFETAEKHVFVKKLVTGLGLGSGSSSTPPKRKHDAGRGRRHQRSLKCGASGRCSVPKSVLPF